MTTLFRSITRISTGMRTPPHPLTALALVFSAAFLVVSTAGAYETRTHELLTRLAVAKSKLALDPTLLDDYGFPSANSTNVNYELSWGQRPQTVSRLEDAVAAGAVWEDDHYPIRAFNHFFDPQADKMSGRALTFLGKILGNTSPSWILEDWGPVSDIWNSQPQEFSFRRGQQALYMSLVGESPATRFSAFSNVLQSLGHIVHHIQDMAQPQHVRNDQHTHPMPVIGGNPDWSFYELWTLNETEQGRTGPVAAQAYPIPVFPTARQFWYTPTTTNAEYFIGMAEFTSKNFVSYGTQYRTSLGSQPQIIGADEYPLPSGVNRDGTLKTFGRPTSETVALPDGSMITGEVEYLYGKIYDGYTDTTHPNVKLGSATLISSFLAAKALPYRQLRFSENSATYRDAQKILLPRAVAFSAGLIDHFFQGRLDLKQSSGDNWLIENRSGQDMAGEFSVYVEGGDGRRTLVPNTTRQAVVGAGQTLNFTFQPPSTTKKLIGVFRGRVGNEGDSTLAGSYVTAGRVIPYSPPVPATPITPCGQPIFAGGGQAGYSNSVELGGSSGTVNVEFEAYTIPDSLEIKTANGKVVATTNGYISRKKIFSFQHNPANGSKVDVRVVGNRENPNTAWTLSVSCPGQATPPPPKVEVTWGVDIPAPVKSNGITIYPCKGTWSFVQPSYFRNAVGGRYELTEGKSYQYTIEFSTTSVGSTTCLQTSPYYIDAIGKHVVRNSTGFIMIQSYGGGGGG